MKAKRFLTFFMACILALSLVSCNDTDDFDADGSADTTAAQTTEAPKVIVTETYKLTEILDKVKTLGRTSAEDVGLACDYSSSGIEFNAYVEGALTIDVTVAKGNEDSREDDCYFALYIDGERSEQRFKAEKNATTTLTLATFETGEVHNIRFVRQTEARSALAALATVSFTGYFEEKPADAKYYIEFMGASNTAGYGNLILGGTATVAEKAENQDSTQSYTYLTAQKLGADYSMISVSGIGVVKGYRKYPIGDVFGASSYYRNKAVDFVPTRTPDLIVMAVGSNDESNGTTMAEYKQGVIDLITKARMTYGDNIPIVWVYYTTDEQYRAAAKEAIAVCGGEGSDIYDVEVLFNKLGGNKHPDLASHIAGAETLSAFIQSKNILK